MDNHIRYCSKHPNELMSLTIDGFVCDICDPPPAPKYLRNYDDGFVKCPVCGLDAKTAQVFNKIWKALCKSKEDEHHWVPEGGWRVGDKIRTTPVCFVEQIRDNGRMTWEYSRG